MREAAAFSQADGRTTLPLDFAPYGSIFVVFRKPITQDKQGTGRQQPATLGTAGTAGHLDGQVRP